MDRMRRYREANVEGFGMCLSEVLSMTSALEATCPVDKIYAVLALCSDSERPRAIVDYNAPLSTTLSKVTSFILESGKILEVLQYAGSGWTDTSLEYPSWVVNWTIPRLPETLAHSPRHLNFCYKAATSESTCISGNSRKLYIKGQISEITAVASTCDKISGGKLSLLTSVDKLAPWLEEADRFLATHYRDRSMAEDVLWRVLIGDRTPKSWPAPASFGNIFKSFKKFIAEFHALSKKYRDDPRELMREIRNHGVFGELNSFEEVAELLRNLTDESGIFCSSSFPRKLAATVEGLIGMVPKGTKCHDVVVLFYGAQVPFVIRRKPKSTDIRSEMEYQLVGECYLHGMMDGEGLKMGQAEQDFTIV